MEVSSVLDNIFASVLITETTTNFELGSFLLCTLASLILGIFVAYIFSINSNHSKGFTVTLALMPAIVQVVIMLVNGNLGTGVAVMGAFSLVRFRSVAGGAKEICSIFLSMAIGLATGMGYIGIAVLFAVILSLAALVIDRMNIGGRGREKALKITIPEGLDYTDVFDDLFNSYTTKHELGSVRTTNMGSLFKLEYSIVLKDEAKEKEFIDALRCRNGNLEIACSRGTFGADTL